MANKLFCANCGAGYDEGYSYCPACGVSTSPQFVRAYNRIPSSHCTICGAATGPRDTYCCVCGAECAEYVPGSGFGPSIRVGGGGSFADSAKNIVPELSRAKDKAVFMPAIVFAVVAVVAGLVLSLIVDMILSESIKGSVGTMFSQAGLPVGDTKLGMLSVWLLSNMGGVFVSVKSGGQTGTFSIMLGVVIMFIIPIASLIAAKYARRAFVDSQYQGKKYTLIDGLLAAAIFAVINVILSFFPTPVSNALKSSIPSSASVTVGSRVIPLFLFSILIAFIVSIPNIRESLNSIGEKNRVVGLSAAAALRFMRDLLLCSLIAAVVMVGYAMIKNGSNALGSNVSKVGMLVLLFNAAVWGASFFTGGSLSISGIGMLAGVGALSSSADASVGTLGLNLGSGIPASVTWYGGILLLIVGLWIAVTAVYRLLRNEQLDPVKAACVIAVPAVLLWLVSNCATIGVVMNIPGQSETIQISSALFLNLILCAVFMAVAVGVVHLTKKNQQLDDIISKIATTPIVCGASAVATLITCLTVTAKVG